MNFSLENKAVLITGAAGTLGQSFCEAFADKGAKVLALDRQESSVKGLVARLNGRFKNAPEALAFELDITDTSQLRDFIEILKKHHIEPDVLINNAATKGSEVSKFFSEESEFSLETWKEVFDVNVTAMYELTRKIGAGMCHRKSGSIVQVSSIYGILAPDQRIYEGSQYLGHQIRSPAVYSASKAAVVGMAKHFASLWGQHNVRVNSLVPGGITSGQNSVFVEKYSARVPLGRMATTQDLVGPILFLASDLSQYYTGQCLIVDGGLSCW